MRRGLMIAITLVTAVLMLALTVPAMAEDIGQVNINTATREQLMSLKGVGEANASRIIAYREKNGQFQAPEDLLKVKGIGEKLLQANQERIVVKEIQQK